MFWDIFSATLEVLRWSAVSSFTIGLAREVVGGIFPSRGWGVQAGGGQLSPWGDGGSPLGLGRAGGLAGGRFLVQGHGHFGSRSPPCQIGIFFFPWQY